MINKENRRAWEKENKKKRRLQDVKLYKIKNMICYAKIRAKRKKLEFNISIDDLGNWRDLEFCPVFPWIKLGWNNEKQNYDSPTIDRINATLGYISNNVRIISWRANDLKRNATKEELEALLKDSLI